MTTIEMCAVAFGLAFCVAFTVVTVAIQWYEWANQREQQDDSQ